MGGHWESSSQNEDESGLDEDELGAEIWVRSGPRNRVLMALYLAHIKPPGPSAGPTRLQRGSESCLGGSTGVQRREDDVMTQNQQKFVVEAGYVADCTIKFYNILIKNNANYHHSDHYDPDIPS